MKSHSIFLRTAYNYDVDSVSNDTALGLLGFEPTLTVQSERDDCDINIIMERFGHGQPVPVNVSTPMQGDFTDVTDFQSAMNLIIAAEQSFMEMPAKVRARFDHDPQQFLDFLSDDNNRAEAESLGLIIKPVLDAPKGSQEPAAAEE